MTMATTSGLGVYRRSRVGKVTRVPIPADAGDPGDISVRGAGDVWLTAEFGVYRTIAPDRELAWDPHECPP
jgi:hypothetical protein